MGPTIAKNLFQIATSSCVECAPVHCPALGVTIKVDCSRLVCFNRIWFFFFLMRVNCFEQEVHVFKFAHWAGGRTEYTLLFKAVNNFTPYNCQHSLYTSCVWGTMWDAFVFYCICSTERQIGITPFNSWRNCYTQGSGLKKPVHGY